MTEPSVERPIDEGPIDESIAWLVDILNMFPWVETISSCGGHRNPSSDQCAEGSFRVEFKLDAKPAAQSILEWLAWAINTDFAQGKGIHTRLRPSSPPPYLAGYGRLTYVIEGRYDDDPNELAALLESVIQLIADMADEKSQATESSS